MYTLASKREVDVTWTTEYLHDFKSLMDTWKLLKQFSWMWCYNPSWNSCSCRTYLLTRKSGWLGDLCGESCVGCRLTDFLVNPAFFYSWHFPRAEEIPPGAASVSSWVWCSLDELWWDCTGASSLGCPAHTLCGLKAWKLDWLSWKTCKVITFVFCPGLEMCFVEYSDKLCAMWDLHLFSPWSMSDQIETQTTQHRGLLMACTVVCHFHWNWIGLIA